MNVKINGLAFITYHCDTKCVYSFNDSFMHACKRYLSLSACDRHYMCYYCFVVLLICMQLKSKLTVTCHLFH